MTAHEFRTARKAMGLTQAELAEKIGRSRTQVNKYESGAAYIPWLVEIRMRDLAPHKDFRRALRPFASYCEALERIGAPNDGVVYALTTDLGRRELTLADFQLAREAIEAGRQPPRAPASRTPR